VTSDQDRSHRRRDMNGSISELILLDFKPANPMKAILWRGVHLPTVPRSRIKCTGSNLFSPSLNLFFPFSSKDDLSAQRCAVALAPVNHVFDRL
jgi:hypothetical protein